VIAPHRPLISSEPFSTFIVLHHDSVQQGERFFMYPVHISMSFLLTKGLNSAVYLILLRFLHRDYAEVFRLVDSIATDRPLNSEGTTLIASLRTAERDWHPDAHACRMKMSLVTMDSGIALPWNLTLECAKYAAKIDSVSCSCQLAPAEEAQLLDSDLVVTSSDAPAFDPKIHDEYSMAVCFNRKSMLNALLNPGGSPDAEIPCRVPPRLLSSNWPYYQDNTVFGANYLQMKEILSIEEGEESWRIMVFIPFIFLLMNARLIVDLRRGRFAVETRQMRLKMDGL